MQHTGKDGALDGELETSAVGEFAQYPGNAEPLPDPPNSNGPPIPVPATGSASISDRITALAIPHQRAGQTIQFPARWQHVLAAKRADNPVAHPTALPLILNEVEIAMASRVFSRTNIATFFRDSAIL